MNWFLDQIQYHYADFEGRSSRSEFWWFFLWVFGISLVTGTLSLFAERMLWTLVMVFLLTILLPTMALTVRRLHDIGWSGWWALLCFIPYFGFGILILCALPSEKSPNRYGVLR